MMEHPVRRRPEEEAESYFVSMTDMMVGLLFIFIVMLVYFALDYQETTAELSGAQSTRTEMLENLEQSLRERGVQVTIDTRTGVLRLPEEVLFATGAWELSPLGQEKVATVANVMAQIVPCYSYGGECPEGRRALHRLDAIFIEGHTDIDPMRGGMDNWDLSAQRAVNTFRALRVAAPPLDRLRNGADTNAQPLLGVSGYGPGRPIAEGDSVEAKARNRRIDLRFLMQTPDGTSENEADEISGMLVAIE